MNILQINSSIRAGDSQSSRLASAIVERLQALRQAAGLPPAQLTLRDLARTPHPALDESALQALTTAAAERSPQQAARVALDDQLIAEIQAADVLVLGVPMYNFAVPSQLKHWFDAIARAGTTFRYTEQGPEGLLKNKQVHLALARGGQYRGTPNDSQLPWLQTMLGFLGMTDVHCFYAEAQSMGEELARAGQTQALAEIQNYSRFQIAPAATTSAAA